MMKLGKKREVKEGTKEFRMLRDLAESIIVFCQENTDCPGTAMNAMVVAMAMVLVEELDRDVISCHVDVVTQGIRDNVDRLMASGYRDRLN